MSGALRHVARGLNFSLRAALRIAPFITLVAGAPLAAQSPRTIENRATAVYQDANGNQGTALGISIITVGDGTGTLVLAKAVDRDSAMIGDTVHYTLTWQNTGNGSVRAPVLTDTLDSSLSFVGGSVQADVAVRTQVSGQVLQFELDDVAAGSSGTLRFAVIVRGGSGEVRNVAHAAFGTGTGTGRVSTDPVVTRITDAAADVRIEKQVNRTQAAAGDTLFYTIHWRNQGRGSATAVTLVDSLPAGLSALGVVAAPPGAAPAIAGNVLTLQLDSIAPADSGSLRLAALVTAAEGTLSNTARASFRSRGDALTALSDTVRTTVQPVEMRLELEALVDRPLVPGDTLPFIIRIINPSATVSIRDVELTDSLPDELEFVRATPPPNGPAATVGAALVQQAAVNWRFDVLPPSDTIEVALYTVVRSVGSGELVNVATARGAGLRQALAAVASAITAQPAGLVIQRTASALEVGTGEAVGYSIIVENGGLLPLTDVKVFDRPGRGFRLQEGSASGAALTRSGGELRFDVGTLGAGARVVLQYVGTLEGRQGDAIENRAWATAAGGMDTDTARIAVRLRGAALATHVALGRVWLDENGDGRQQRNEKGLAHAVIWASQGMTIRADSLGRFTVPELVTGRHTLRVDPLSVPAGYVNAEPASIRVDGFSSPVATFALRRDTAAVASARDSVSAGFLLGNTFVPRPRFAAPADGATIGTDQLFLRLEGEPGAQVQLFDNERLVRSEGLRPDGSQDFIGVAVEPGPHVFEARVTGTGGDQKIAVRVHVSGAVKSAARSDTSTLRAGSTQRLAFRVLDEWGVPVATQPAVTVQAEGARILEPDADASSVGHQLPTGPNGYLLVPLLADSARTARLRLSYGEMKAEVALDFLPQIRSLVVLGSGEIGIGAAADAYGAAVARGALDERTSVTLSYDSRRNERSTFGGAFDPLGEAQYPLQGDASERSILGSATQPLALRIERDRSWLLVGDVDTRGFGSDAAPGAYWRALPGVSARFSQGALDVVGFGSSVAQQLVQRQIRGNGTSGPYDLGGPVRLGTERLVLETRDRMNASRVIAQEELERFVDYDVDPVTGTVLLRRPLLSQDVAGNPLVLVALAERIDGESAFVGGAHAALTLTPFGGARDSVHVGGGYIRDESELAGHTIVSGELGASTRFGGSMLEVARVEHADSAGTAFRAGAWLGSRTGTGATLEWSRAGSGFFNPANPRVVAGTEDVRIGANAAFGGAWSARGSYARQWFRSAGAERQQGSMTLERALGESRLSLDLGALDERLERDTLATSFTSATSRLTYAFGKDAVWLEALQPLRNEGAPDRPATYGAGARYDVGYGISLEGAHRILKTDSSTEGLTTVGLRTELSTKTRLWSEYQLLDNVSGQSSAALVGIGQKLRLSGAWSVDAQYERRTGIAQLPETDPTRALPFSQLEPEYWAASLGTEWKPSAAVRASLRGELNDGEQSGRGYRVFGSAEAALSQSLTLFARQDSRELHRTLSEGLVRSRSSRSILAAAFRPAASSAWNSLLKLEYRNDENPQRTGATLLRGNDERLIGALESIWTPAQGSELGMRLALRRATLEGLLANGASVTAHTQFAGLRARQALTGRFDVRGAARLLGERESGLLRWDFAPALGIVLVPGLELEAGYRLGDLRDADFARSGGQGAYLSLGLSFTEDTGRALAEFWRARLEANR